ncbi:alpha/beta hydrolase family esterase [Microlunatus soli]|nr:PHB depolymerase family esterase [Microlunatus soli]
MSLGTQPVTAEGGSGPDLELTVEHRGVPFDVPVFVPAGVGRHPLLVLDLHSSHGNAASQAECSRLDAWADRRGWVIARPEGVIEAELPNVDRLWLWNVPDVPTTTGLRPTERDRDDVAFLTDVVDTAAERFGTGRRAALVGMSGGARMASAYAAARPDRVAALAAVAGLRADGVDQGAAADRVVPAGHRREPVPVLAIHGDADDTNPWQGGAGPRWQASVPAAVDGWVTANDCHRPGVQTAEADRVTRIAYAGTDSRSNVTLYRIAGGGHSWPGSAEPDAFPGLDATALIADFFSLHAGI